MTTIWLQALGIIMCLMVCLWIVSIFIRNVSIVDIFWGTGFIIASTLYYISSPGNPDRKMLVLILTIIWGLRLSAYIALRNAGKGEDFRYREFRKKYGENRYWWISFFQTFLLQGILMWLISAPLLGAQYQSPDKGLSIADYAGAALWLTGFVFEAGGDLQMSQFRKNPENRGKVLESGLWKFTRHPNYFGDAAVWWGFGILSVAAGSWLPAMGSLLMTVLIIKVSGVALLEKSLIEKKPGYREYAERTSAFLPWFPGKKS